MDIGGASQSRGPTITELLEVLIIGCVTAHVVVLAASIIRLVLSIKRGPVPAPTPLPSTVRATASQIEHYPFVSIHVPVHGDERKSLVATLNSLAKVLYTNYEVIVVDYQPTKSTQWYPTEHQCRRLGSQFRLLQPTDVKSKAGALNHALRKSRKDAALIAVVEPGQEVDNEWLLRTVQHFDDPNIGIIQVCKKYKEFEGSWFATMANAEFEIHRAMRAGNSETSSIALTLPLVRKRALQQARGWSRAQNDYVFDLAKRIEPNGYSSSFVDRALAQSAIAITYNDYADARRFNVFSEIQNFTKHWKSCLRIPSLGNRQISSTTSTALESFKFLVRTMAIAVAVPVAIVMEAAHHALSIPSLLMGAWVTLVTLRVCVRLIHTYLAEGFKPSFVISAAIVRLSLQHASAMSAAAAILDIKIVSSTKSIITESKLAIACLLLGSVLAGAGHGITFVLGLILLARSFTYACTPLLRSVSNYDVRRERIWSQRVERRIDSLLPPVHIDALQPADDYERKLAEHARSRFGVDLRHEPTAAERSFYETTHPQSLAE